MPLQSACPSLPPPDHRFSTRTLEKSPSVPVWRLIPMCQKSRNHGSVYGLLGSSLGLACAPVHHESGNRIIHVGD